MSRIKAAKIYWSYPILFENAILGETSRFGWGIYYISRKFGKKETLLYIGLTFDQNFKSRLDSHMKNWLLEYRGLKYIRFGEILRPQIVTKDVIEDIESCLIFELNPIHNISKTSTYSYTHEYKLVNTGYRGVIPNEILMKHH